MSPSLPTGKLLRRYAPFLAIACALAWAASCAKAPPPSSAFYDAGGEDPGGYDAPAPVGTSTPGAGDSPSGGPSIVIRPDASNDKCTTDHPCQDFPSAPEFAGGAPMNAPTMFGPAGTGSTTGGPCLAEPADGALYPKNWLRPRVLWAAASPTQTLFEVRVHADGEANDYVVYTDKTSWTMPAAMWKTIAYTGGTPSVDGSLMGKDLTFTVRAMSATGGMPTLSNSAKITIAPAIADGALIYWTTAGFDNNATSTTLQGFHVGDEGTSPALTSSQVQQPVRGVPVDGGNLTTDFQQVWCIGCHTATPDGNYVAFTAQWPWASTLASIQAGSPGAVPPWIGKGAIQNLSPDYNVLYNPPAVNQIMLGIGAFSPGHYAAGDRIYLATLGNSWNSFSLKDPGVPSGVTSQIAWFNLEWDNATTMAGGLLTTGLPAATPCTQGTYPGIMGGAQACIPAPTPDPGWGIVARTGDPNGAGAPSWSHNLDGKTDFIAYTSTNVGVKDGRLDCTASATCTADVFIVPYGSNGPGLGGKGGPAKGLTGASDPKYNEYYPAWSPDDKFIAFNRVPAGTSMYNQAKADLYVVPYNGGAGGPATALKSNDPVACTGFSSGTVQNTWPKWAPNPLGGGLDGGASGVPTPQVIDGKTYYWLTFSSIRSLTSPTDPTNDNKRKQQLYVTGMVVDNATQAITTYAPIYLWNQDFTVNNLIPAWGEFSIPPGTMPPPMEAGVAQ